MSQLFFNGIYQDLEILFILLLFLCMGVFLALMGIYRSMIIFMGFVVASTLWIFLFS